MMSDPSSSSSDVLLPTAAAHALAEWPPVLDDAANPMFCVSKYDPPEKELLCFVKNKKKNTTKNDKDSAASKAEASAPPADRDEGDDDKNAITVSCPVLDQCTDWNAVWDQWKEYKIHITVDDDHDDGGSNDMMQTQGPSRVMLQIRKTICNDAREILQKGYSLLLTLTGQDPAVPITNNHRPAACHLLLWVRGWGGIPHKTQRDERIEQAVINSVLVWYKSFGFPVVHLSGGLSLQDNGPSVGCREKWYNPTPLGMCTPLFVNNHALKSLSLRSMLLDDVHACKALVSCSTKGNLQTLSLQDKIRGKATCAVLSGLRLTSLSLLGGVALTEVDTAATTSDDGVLHDEATLLKDAIGTLLNGLHVQDLHLASCSETGTMFSHLFMDEMRAFLSTFAESVGTASLVDTSRIRGLTVGFAYWYASKITDEDVKLLVRASLACPKLERLHMSGWEFKDPLGWGYVWKHLTQHPTLEHIRYTVYQKRAKLKKDPARTQAVLDCWRQAANIQQIDIPQMYRDEALWTEFIANRTTK